MSLLDSYSRLVLLASDSRKSKEFFDDLGIKKLFLEIRLRINHVLEKTEFFHGTGRKSYKLDGDSETQDNLITLVNEGLAPREDIFNDSLFEGEVDSTVSLTRQRMYARCYACMNLPEETDLQYEYGSRKFWITYFFRKMILFGLKDEKLLGRTIKNWIKTRDEQAKFIEKSKLWARTIRNDDKYSKKPRIGALQLLKSGKSTIPDNHPLIIGIRKGKVDPLENPNPTFAKYEERTSQAIPPKHWSYLGVPLANIEEFNVALEELGLNLDVLPMELVELCMADMDFEKLI
ncbi:hypothetical protein ACFLZH_03605 [Patescibacteria group bacterium]